MHLPTLRQTTAFLRTTPLHPQWLLGHKHSSGKWISKHANGVVLDIGCADRWIERFLPHGSTYIGLDYPATGKELYRARPDVFADASLLPLMDSSVDTVVILEVLEHLRYPTDALRETARVLRSHGRILLTMPFLYPIHDAPHDYQRLTKHGLIRDIEAVGLHVDSLSPTLTSMESAGLLACLAMGGSAMHAVRLRSWTIFLVPLLLVAIPVVNLLAWLGGRVFPSWGAITSGYRLVASIR